MTRKRFLTPETLAELKNKAEGLFPGQPDLADEMLTQVMVPMATANAKALLVENPDGVVATIKAQWDRDAICALLLKSDRAVERALLLLLSKQTADEQAHASTLVVNGQGFTSLDAEFYTALAKRVVAGEHLSSKMLFCLRKLNKVGRPRVGKYWKQIQAEIITKKLAEAVT